MSMVYCDEYGGTVESGRPLWSVTWWEWNQGHPTDDDSDPIADATERVLIFRSKGLAYAHGKRVLQMGDNVWALAQVRQLAVDPFTGRTERVGEIDELVPSDFVQGAVA